MFHCTIFVWKKGKISNKWQIENLHELVLQDYETSENYEKMKTNEKGLFSRYWMEMNYLHN